MFTRIIVALMLVIAHEIVGGIQSNVFRTIENIVNVNASPNAKT